MRKLAGRALGALALMTSLALAAPVSVGAKTPSPITTVQQYRVALHAYVQAKDAIDATVHRAILAARTAEDVAILAATTPAQIYVARVNFNEVRATDIAAWQAALTKLGPPPRNPLAPTSTTSTTSTTLVSLSFSAHELTQH